MWIKLEESDPKKPIFNPRIIADIVTSSIKGLFKKFKNAITKNDVVFIQDFADEKKDSEALGKLQRLLPD